MYCDGCAKSEELAVKAERENLALRAETTALKARLAEAEKALAELKGHAAEANHQVWERCRKAEAELAEIKKDRDAWKRDSLMWSKAWERELDGYYWPKTHRIDAAVLSTQKLVQRMKEAEAKLAEAEADLGTVRESNQVLRDTLARNGNGWAAAVKEKARADAADRERDEAEARCKEEKSRRQVAEADMRKSEEHRLAAVAESVRYERKRAELSEALRAWAFELRAYVPHDKENGTAILVAKIESIAALASQPAPEAKPEMSAEVPPHMEAIYIESGSFQGGEEDASSLGLKINQDEECIVMKKADFGSLVRRLHKLPTPEAP
jgi:hypothetical protein